MSGATFEATASGEPVAGGLGKLQRQPDRGPGDADATLGIIPKVLDPKSPKSG